MKAILFLCLLAFMTCEKDIIDIGKCIYKAPKVQELISDVIVAIVTQDFTKLLPKVKEALPDLIKTVLGCIIDTKAVEDEAKLEELPPLQPFVIRPIGGCYEEGKARCKAQCHGESNICYNYCVQVCGGVLPPNKFPFFESLVINPN